MGAFKSRTCIRISGQPGWEPSEWIDVKGTVTAEDMEAITVQETSLGKDGKPQMVSRISMVAALQAMIDEWNLLGDNDTPVALYTGIGRQRRKRMDIIAKLPAEYMAPVMNTIGELVQNSQVVDPLDLPTSVSEPTSALLAPVN